MTTREPEFTRSDKNWLLALQAYESDIGPHGYPMSEAVDAGSAHKFVADPVPTIDFVAQAIGDAQDAYYKSWPNVSRHGHLWSAKRRPAAS